MEDPMASPGDMRHRTRGYHALAVDMESEKLRVWCSMIGEILSSTVLGERAARRTRRVWTEISLISEKMLRMSGHGYRYFGQVMDWSQRSSLFVSNFK